MIVILWFVFLIILLFINTNYFKSKINYLNVFMFLFCSIMILSNFGFYGFKKTSIVCNIYMFIALVFFECFSLFFLRIKTKSSNKKIDFKCNTNSLFIPSIIITIYILPFALSGVNIILTEGYAALRAKTMILSNSYLTTLQHIIVIYFVISLAKAITVYSIIDCIENKKINKTLIVSIINILLTVLTFAGRGILLYFVFLTIVIISCTQKKKNIINMIRNYKKFIIIISIVIIFISSITSQRKLNKDSSLLLNVYSYYVGSIHLFDIHLNNSLLSEENLLYGNGMFSPLVDIYKMSSKFFGINTSVKSGVEIINQQVQQYYKVTDRIALNNNVTFLYVPLRDFGFIGLIIGPLYISAIFAIAYKKYKHFPTTKNKALYYYLCSILPFFIFEFYLNKTNTFITILYIIFLPNVFFKKERKDIHYEA